MFKLVDTNSQQLTPVIFQTAADARSFGLDYMQGQLWFIRPADVIVHGV